MDPREFYQLARVIVSQKPPPGPAQCRTAIGRAYFAVLNVAVDTLAGLGVSCGKGSQKHGLAVRYLHATDDEHLKTASSTLDYLRTERNHADYSMERTDVEKVSRTRDIVDRARDVLDDLDAVEGEPSRKHAATKNIEIHKKRTGIQ